MKLEDWRNEIDLIDAEIIKLINRRARIAQKIGTLKIKTGLPVVDSDREAKIINNIRRHNQGALDDRSMIGIFRKIIHESRRIQTDVAKKTNVTGAEVY